VLESPTPIAQVSHGTQALLHQLYVPTFLYVRFIFAADKAGGVVKKPVKKRDIYVYIHFSQFWDYFSR
jgi:hypothetical protein